MLGPPPVGPDGGHPEAKPDANPEAKPEAGGVAEAKPEADGGWLAEQGYDDVPAGDEEAYAASQKENEERARASVEAQKEEWARWSNSEDTTPMWQIASSGGAS